MQGVTEPIKRILNSHNVKVAQKPFQTLGHIFAKPQDPVTKEQRTDAIYSIPCNDCDILPGCRINFNIYINSIFALPFMNFNMHM